MKLSSLLMTILSAIFLVAGVILIVLVNFSMRQQALEEAQSKARIILDRNLATHTYFTHQLKPSVFELAGEPKSEVPFDPVWMSSTYAVREIDDYFQELSESGYYYKECAINARSPANEADAFEKKFIRELNKDPDLIEKTAIRTMNEHSYFQVLRKSETMEQTCLTCHSKPEMAPEGLVQKYGARRSFGREEGEVISAISIRIPLEQAYSQANAFSMQLSAMLLVLLGILYAILILIHKRLVHSPLAALQRQAQGITEDPGMLGTKVNPPAIREFSNLAEQFNTMSSRLKKSMDHLEDQVQVRTGELQRTNEQLEREVEQKTEAEAALIQERNRLQEVLDEVKTLRGLIPICAHCKKVRNDQGIWNQIESYMREHTEARFTHGLCPECEALLYPDQDED
ncbi:MAG: DUF3365 domain-containing protein [Desulfovermiculus sp.]|nr:DUF3365 domain-containing protein [Desulfovermiculus sp.]